jgi:glycosyltransferase involved in cell wall biosynthesis
MGRDSSTGSQLRRELVYINGPVYCLENFQGSGNERGRALKDYKIRVLHITDCYDAGVFASINTLARDSKEVEHSLLYSGGGQVPKALFASAKPFARSDPFRRTLETWKAIKNFEGEIVHLHSTRAGILGRLLPQRLPILYQPHGAHYLDLSVGRFLRLFSKLVEKILALQTSGFLGVSHYEASELAKIREGVPAFLVTNAIGCSKWPESNDNGRLHVVMNGRIHKVKDPVFFKATVELIRQTHPNAKFTWIGDGDSKLRKILTSAGVDVTGWLDSHGVHQILNSATLYFHSSMSDGLAYSILESASHGLPIVARALPHFEGYNLNLVSDPEGAAQMILRVFNDPEFRINAKSVSVNLSQENSPMVRGNQYTSALRAVLSK